MKRRWQTTAAGDVPQMGRHLRAGCSPQAATRLAPLGHSPAAPGEFVCFFHSISFGRKKQFALGGNNLSQIIAAASLNSKPKLAHQ